MSHGRGCHEKGAGGLFIYEMARFEGRTDGLWVTARGGSIVRPHAKCVSRGANETRRRNASRDKNETRDQNASRGWYETRRRHASREGYETRKPALRLWRTWLSGEEKKQARR